MADISVSGGVEDNGPFVLNAPSSLTSCTLVNITWTGGTPPYALRASFNVLDDSLKFLPENIAHGITATHFLWNNTVVSGILVSLEVSDGLAVTEITPIPIVVDIPIGSACSHPFIPQLVDSQSSTTVATPTSSTSTSAFSTSSVHTSGTTTVSFPALPSPTSDSMTSVAPQQHVSVLSGSSIALIVIGVIVIILLGTFFWWRSRTMTGERRCGRKDAEKQCVADGGDGDEPTELWGSDADWRDGHSSPTAGYSEERLHALTPNPFETPENVVYPVEQIFMTSPVSEAGAGPGDRSPPPTHSPVLSSPPSTMRAFQVDNAAPGQGARPFGPKTRAVPRLPERMPSVSAHSEGSSTRTSTLSDTHAARLSTSTSSTLPPSYRTRRSAGSIYVPTGTDLQNYPAFSPPAYTPAPPSAFRPGTQTRTPRRAPRRRVPAPVPGKVHEEVRAASQSARSSTSSTSGEREPGAYVGHDEGRVEGSVREEEDTDADLTFSGRGRDGSVPDDLSAREHYMDILDGVDNVGETGMDAVVRAGTERTS